MTSLPVSSIPVLAWHETDFDGYSSIVYVPAKGVVDCNMMPADTPYTVWWLELDISNTEHKLRLTWQLCSPAKEYALLLAHVLL